MSHDAVSTSSETMRRGVDMRVLYDEPAFSEVFMSCLLARTMRVEEDLVDQLFNSSEKRLARLRLLLANSGEEGRPEPLIHPAALPSSTLRGGSGRGRGCGRPQAGDLRQGGRGPERPCGRHLRSTTGDGHAARLEFGDASSAQTRKPGNAPGPKICVRGTSAASRPWAMRMRPIRGALLRGSKVCQRPPS